MKKTSIISLIIYILYALAGGGLAIYSQLALNQNNEGWAGLGLAIVMVLGIGVGIVGIVGIILKSIHIKTDSIVFGCFCVYLDVFCIHLLLDSGTGDTVTDVILSVLPALCVVAVSLICNLISLKKK